MVKVSIAIAHWNVRDLLDRCLRSLARSEGVELDVIVVDNGSTDGSAAMVAGKYPWVRLVVNEENLGFERATNQAIKLARADYILVLNSDTEVEPRSIVTLLHVLDSDQQAGLATCTLVYPSGQLQKSCFRFFTTVNTLAHAVYLDRVLPNWRIFHPLLMVDCRLGVRHCVEWACASCWLVRREAINQVGLFDERGFCGGGDQEWCFRLASRWRAIYSPATNVLHHHGKSTFNYEGEDKELWQRRSLQHETQSTYRFLLDHRGRLSAWFYLAVTSRMQIMANLTAWGLYRLARRAYPHEWAADSKYAHNLLKLLLGRP